MMKYKRIRSQIPLRSRRYRMVKRHTAMEQNRERILASARALLLAEDFSEFSMEAVARKAGVIRPTVYYQFKSKAGLLEQLYDYIAARGKIQDLAAVFRYGNDPLQHLHEFIRFFVNFWQSDRELIRRLHALGAIDSEIGRGLRARNERRKNGLKVIVERYQRWYLPLTPLEKPVAVDTLHMLTSFETFDALAVPGRTVGDTAGIIQKLCYLPLRYQPRFIPPR
jgi:AcrR family transcriptional regulator